MELNEYQDRARETDVAAEHGLPYYALGLAGEAGEIANEVKKMLRDDGGKFTADRREHLRDEVGDALWYAAMLADHLGCSLDSIAERNLRKLDSRRKRGMLSGSGDER